MIVIIGRSRLGLAIKARLPGAKVLSRQEGIQYTEEGLKPYLKHAEVVIVAAGRTRGNEEELFKEHVGLAKAVVKAAPKNIPILYASSISVYGKGAVVGDESLPLNPDTPYAKAKAAAEKEILKHSNSIVFRIGTMYGFEYKNYSTMFSFIRRGFVPIFGNGENNVPFTYIRDVAKAFSIAVDMLLKGKELNHRIYNISSKGATLNTTLNIAAKYLGRKPFILHISLSLAKILGRVCDFFNCLFNTETVLSLSSDRHINSLRAKNEGLFNETPIEEGIKEVVSEYERRNR